jgi:hypothetical protein
MSQVRVYNTDVLSGILEAGAAATEKAPSAASQRRPPQRSTPDSMDSSVAREKQRRDMREKAFRTRMERLHKDVERRIKQTTEQRELKFQHMLRSYEQERDGFEHVSLARLRPARVWGHERACGDMRSMWEARTYCLQRILALIGVLQDRGLQGGDGPAKGAADVSGVVHERVRQDPAPCGFAG